VNAVKRRVEKMASTTGFPVLKWEKMDNFRISVKVWLIFSMSMDRLDS
jgi:hypothetical protein